MSTFRLDPILEQDTLAVGDLPLCMLRLMNDTQYPWLVLVPRQPACVEIYDLAEVEQARLHAEVRLCALALQAECKPDKLNIAALGNQVSQLHVHVIARFRSDAAWPAPVWGMHLPIAYPDRGKELIGRLRQRLANLRLS